jgi:glutamyl-tRNA(Gln) amidotransferase subunit E
MKKFEFKPFTEMTPADYAEVGFKSGLEIHQQLLTEKKLFCRCPAGKYSDSYDAEILRHMRPTLSELGEYDGTALMEFKTKKNIVYRIKRETVCTYEMDDTPPFLMNEDALDSALGIGMLLNCSLVDEVHIARKQYLDGSIPTGFQRTAIFALDGSIPFKGREISIIQMSIEEDSCREVSDFGHDRVYLTDRLGMPLIETVTGPDMKTPDEVAEVVDICRRLVRSTGRVRSGIGSARQDVNVSVEGGTRIEIKGVDKLIAIPLLTYNEAMRQWNLLQLRDELHSRGINKDTFKAYSEDITRLIKKTNYQPIRHALNKGFILKCVVLEGYKDILHWRTQTDTYFSKEISDRVRVIACLTALPNIVHSDSKGETLSSAEWLKIRKSVNAGKDDTIVLVWGNEQDTTTAVNEIIIRAKEAAIGIPSETRQALNDGTNGFERILPGADRMYPDTDLPPIKITKERLNKIKEVLPLDYWTRENWYKELGVPEDIIRFLSISPYTSLFKQAVEDWKLDPVLTSVFLIQFTKRLKRSFKLEVNKEVLNDLLIAYKNGLIPKDGLLYAMRKMAEENLNINDIISPAVSSEELEKTFIKAESEVTSMKLINKNNKEKLILGFVMNNLRGRINGKTAAERKEVIHG